MKDVVSKNCWHEFLRSIWKWKNIRQRIFQSGEEMNIPILRIMNTYFEKFIQTDKILWNGQRISHWIKNVFWWDERLISKSEHGQCSDPSGPGPKSGATTASGERQVKITKKMASNQKMRVRPNAFLWKMFPHRSIQSIVWLNRNQKKTKWNSSTNLSAINESLQHHQTSVRYRYIRWFNQRISWQKVPNQKWENIESCSRTSAISLRQHNIQLRQRGKFGRSEEMKFVKRQRHLWLRMQPPLDVR